MFARQLVKAKAIAIVGMFLCVGAISPLMVMAAPINVSYSLAGSAGD